MNKLIFLPIIASLTAFAACTEQGPATSDTSDAAAADSTAIAATIHGFYGWYNGFASDTTQAYDFTDASGQHLRLKPDVLEKYLGEFRKSGFVSEEFIANEQKFYAACEKLWQNEAVDDVPSGMDADKMFCAQDWEFAEFTTAPVSSRVNADKATASIMFSPNSPNGESRSFELKKENGKWLLTKVICDTGVIVE